MSANGGAYASVQTRLENVSPVTSTHCQPSSCCLHPAGKLRSIVIEARGNDLDGIAIQHSKQQRKISVYDLHLCRGALHVTDRLRHST